MTVAPGNATLVPQQTAGFTATLRDAGGNTLTGRAVAWSIQPAGAATVDLAGTVTGVAPGATNLVATSEGRTGTAAITVLDGGFVGPAGGQVVAAGGNVTLVVPAGAVAAGTAMTVTPVPNPPADPYLIPGTAYDLAPSGIQFAQPVTLAIRYNPAGLPVGANPAQFRLARLVGAAWTPIPGSAVNLATNTVIAQLAGFSIYAIVEVLPPVASVTIQGSFRIKVGDDYVYTATARLSDGTVVVRPITWGILETSRGIMTPGGLLTPLATGTITILAVIDGVVWEVTATAYDWDFLSASGSLFLSLPADNLISNKFGTSEYAELVIACSQTGTFLLWVDTEHFVTANGGVSYFFDNGPILSQTWIEFDLFSALGHPGPTNLATKNFALTMAASRKFGFAFTEYQGLAKAMSFRVTGLAGLLVPLFTACPGSSLRVGPGPDLKAELEAARAVIRSPSLPTAERASRQAAGPQAVAKPLVEVRAAEAEARAARRRP